jgi:hypothetical protein
VLVLVVFVMHVEVLMFRRFVDVGVLVAFREVEPHAGEHQEAARRRVVE